MNNKKQKREEEEEEEDIKNIEEIILNAIFKFAKARYIFCNAFEARNFNSRDGYVSHDLQDIEKASDSFDNLLTKVQENYDMPLWRWIELKILPELEKLVKLNKDAGSMCENDWSFFFFPIERNDWS